MTVRIRYEKFEDPHGLYNLVSVRNFHSNKYTISSEDKEGNDAMYIVYIDTKYTTYMIRNMSSMVEFTGGEELNNLQVLKRHVKTRLENLGVSFDDEIRDNASRIPGENCGYKGKSEKKWDFKLMIL